MQNKRIALQLPKRPLGTIGERPENILDEVASKCLLVSELKLTKHFDKRFNRRISHFGHFVKRKRERHRLHIFGQIIRGKELTKLSNLQAKLVSEAPIALIVHLEEIIEFGHICLSVTNAEHAQKLGQIGHNTDAYLVHVFDIAIKNGHEIGLGVLGAQYDGQLVNRVS